MKRLVLLAIAVLALAIPAMATARVTSVTLTGPTSVVIGQHFTLTGDLTKNDNGKHTLIVSAFAGDQCGGSPVFGPEGIDIGKATTFELPFVIKALGSFAFQVAVSNGPEDMVSACHVVVVNDVAQPDEDGMLPAAFVPTPNVFLCYSAYQDQPGVWPATEASKLFAAGYWQPFAVSGTVPGGTNLGGHHLTCNLATGQSVADIHGYLGGGGEVYGADLHGAMETLLGTYPVVG